MSITITDPVLLAQLVAAREPVELRGPNGEFVGTFHPPFGVPRPGFKPPISDDEMERRRQEKTGRPLKDILRDLVGPKS